MGITFVDRESTYPGRYKVTKGDGTTEYLTLERADEPTVEGTPLNAAVLNGAFEDVHTEIMNKIPSMTPTGGSGSAAFNYLDNSNFRIAQAGYGGTHGTQAYAADRWILSSGSVSYTAGEGLTLNGTIVQKLEEAPSNMSAFVGTASGSASISYDPSAKEVTITSNGGVLKWAALYEGEYTTENAPEYQPKGYAHELMECMRYYYRNWDGELNTSGMLQGDFDCGYIVFDGDSLTIPFPIPMRDKPTVTLYNPTTGVANNVDCRYKNVDGGCEVHRVSSKRHHFSFSAFSFKTGDVCAYCYEASADL